MHALRAIGRIALPTFLLVAAVGGGAATADETVHLKNGDRITGRVVQLVDGKLEVQTSYGKLIIPRDRVARIEFAVDPLQQFMPQQETVQELVEAIRRAGERGAEGGGEDLLDAARDLLEAYRSPSQEEERQKRMADVMRRLERLLPRRRPPAREPEVPADPKEGEPGEGEPGEGGTEERDF